MRTVCLLVGAMMALSRAAAAPEPEVNETSEAVLRGGSSLIFCPAGWTAIDGRCFLYVPSTVTWAQAEKKCISLGGNLASVHSLGEHHKIQNLILTVTQTFPLTWIGGTDAQEEGTWFWSDGTPFQFTYWSIGQPDNHEEGDCLAMNFGDDKKFDDQLCSNLRPFICSKKP